MGRSTIISNVITNVIVLCEYLPQEFPLWGTIKGYCVVLCCVVLCCVVLCCVVLCCVVLCCIVLYCIVLYCIVLYCIVCVPAGQEAVEVCATDREDEAVRPVHGRHQSADCQGAVPQQDPPQTPALPHQSETFTATHSQGETQLTVVKCVLV